MNLTFRPKDECTYDLVSLGEVMLRLDPADRRIKTARTFTAWEGGGEYNVARGARRCFSLKTAIVTSLVDNEVGRLIEDLVLQGGVDPSLIHWVPFDGMGVTARNGLNFTERGFGVRGALGVSDRGHTAVSQLQSADIDWDYIFGTLGVRWFHTGGIYAALSKTSAETVITAIKKAKEYGTIVSYDLNYRASLWTPEQAQLTNKEIAPYVDVMIGNEEDFMESLGLAVENSDENLSNLDIGSYKSMVETAVATYPNFKVVGTTLREVKTATVNAWSAICYSGGVVYEGISFPNLEIYDRVGGGDSFASGLIYGLMETGNPQTAVNYGVAHGALAMTTPGDTSMASQKEVEALMAGGTARVKR